jgi:hypothetical protein
MRSRGIVQVSKIRSAEVEAAVRIVWLANGRRHHYSRGIDALRDQMGQAEDLARVDIPLYIKGDIGSELDKKQHTYGPLEWPQSILRWVVLWAWSRKPEHIEWTRAGMEAIWKDSKALSDQFHTSIPIFQPNEAGVRLARMAAAVAARLFSSPDGFKLVIDEEHVHAARRLYELFLGSKALGITDLKSREEKVAHSGDEYGVEYKEFLRTTPPMVRQMLSTGSLPHFGFGSIDIGGNMVSKLGNMNAVVYHDGQYEVAPWATDIARDMSS